MDYLNLIIIALIALVILGMGGALLFSTEAQKKQRMMSVIRGRITGGGKGQDQKTQQDKRRAEIARKLKEQGNLDDSKKDKITMSNQLEQAGLPITVKQFWLFSFLLSLILSLVAKFILGQSALVVLAVAVIGLLGVPKFFMRWKRKRRQKKFLSEFAEALEAMVRLLKAGMPVAEAIRMASKEFEGPVGEEMERIYEAQKIGVPLYEAALDAAKRMPLTEMQMFATGIAIQAQTGASLSEVLMNLAGVIRSRFKLRRKVQALSSEAKSSAMIIGALPIVVGGGLSLIRPEFTAPLFNTNIGHVLLIGSACWMGLGIFVMKLMINFKV